jgi:hypothetical protein
MTVRSYALLVLFCSCARAPVPPASDTSGGVSADGSSVGPGASGGSATARVTAGSGNPTGTDSGARAPGLAAAAASAPAPVAPEPFRAEGGGIDFVDEARLLFRVAACGSFELETADGSADAGPAMAQTIDARFDAHVLARHCDELGRAYAEYKKSWVEVVMPLIASFRPNDLPHAVVYPFGGGDLASALATFPDATAITTISLEPAGDIRPIDKLPGDRLAHELGVHRSHLERLFEKAHSRTDNLEKESKTELPGELVFALAALVVYGDEPVSLRYFRLRPDGSVAYVTEADIDAARGIDARRALFENAELVFRRADPAARAGSASAAPPPFQVLRHISYNLDDYHLGHDGHDGSLLAHLDAEARATGGKVAAMTKAASHLLWSDHFSTIRGWLIEHTDWMISDSTGIPPRFAGPAGFVQDTYGTFTGPAPFGLLDARDAADDKKLFASQPARELTVRYGYPDKDGHGHIIVTRRPPPPGADD